ncbi:MAG: FAD-dependent monooxygenase [Bradyrhizobium sp.]|uniref:FAD-dependent monooxygenase n=1 Tax=Bradyrhizobium sp. TaxID=376 RepID=UPI001DC96B1E|nr:FAD-dependent monooxygenase [Bradyrhizobium sp.]MBV9561343.1 FAD-dependent monooxygenase [Bradyrhizobium sp.]
MPQRLNFAILGAGIGGLSAALALEARGIDVTVFENANSPREAGAGISIPPNAARLLRRTRLCEAIDNITTRSQGLTLRTSHGEPVSRPGAPTPQSYQIHRVELLDMLSSATKGKVRFGHRCVSVEQTGPGARLTFANGAVCDADAVIGADGIHSIVQRAIGLKAHPTSEGVVAYRGLVQSKKLSWSAELRGLNMWMGAGRSFICFPVSQGRLINIVAFVPSPRDMEESWFAAGDISALVAEFDGWDAPVCDLIAALDETFRWGIYDRPALPYWSRGCVTLLGDAAHPMVPHFGQGAGQAIEDGFALAVLLEHATHDEMPARLKAYQDLRLERTSRVQAASRLAGQFYRSVGGDATEQAQRMRSWMSEAEWIFPYDVEAAALRQLQFGIDAPDERSPPGSAASMPAR